MTRTPLKTVPSDRIPDPVDPVKDEIETIINRIKNVVKNPFDNTVVNLISEGNVIRTIGNK